LNSVNFLIPKTWAQKYEIKWKFVIISASSTVQLIVVIILGYFSFSFSFLLSLWPFRMLPSFFFWEVKIFRLLLGFSIYFFRSFDTFLLPLWLLFLLYFIPENESLIFPLESLVFYISNFQWKCFIKIVLVLFPIKWSNSNIDVVAYYTKKRLMNKRHWLGCLERISKECLVVQVELEIFRSRCYVLFMICLLKTICRIHI